MQCIVLEHIAASKASRVSEPGSPCIAPNGWGIAPFKPMQTPSRRMSGEIYR
jgi:hypothetical protein